MGNFSFPISSELAENFWELSWNWVSFSPVSTFPSHTSDQHRTPTIPGHSSLHPSEAFPSVDLLHVYFHHDACNLESLDGHSNGSGPREQTVWWGLMTSNGIWAATVFLGFSAWPNYWRSHCCDLHSYPFGDNSIGSVTIPALNSTGITMSRRTVEMASFS